MLTGDEDAAESSVAALDGQKRFELGESRETP